LRHRHVDVVGAGQVAGGADERVVVEHVQDAGHRDEHVVLVDLRLPPTVTAAVAVAVTAAVALAAVARTRVPAAGVVAVAVTAPPAVAEAAAPAAATAFA